MCNHYDRLVEGKIGTLWWEEYTFASASRAVGILEHVRLSGCVSNLSNFCISLKEIIIYCSTLHAVKYCPPAAIPAPPPLQLDVGGSGEIMRQRVKV